MHFHKTIDSARGLLRPLETRITAALGLKPAVLAHQIARIGLTGVRVGFGAHVYDTLKGVILGRQMTGKGPRQWVLDGIDLQVAPGDRLGIVGANGSGKTTLLKVIAGILPPVQGRAEVVGHVAPLIAQGLGLDNQLSVRVNIKIGLAYASRLAEHSRELEDRILEFAELEDYADEPMGHLSSGMRARLAFAISLHENPEILLLDEVFATGDMHFVKKAQQAMLDCIGRTPIVIIVSHSNEIIRDVCSRCVLIERGRLIADGGAQDILSLYAERA
jgi:lipopolysaccharide transport system ATP-binding protein